jgi:hypothetical protein
MATVLWYDGSRRRWNVGPAGREEEVAVWIEDRRKGRGIVVGWKKLR